MKLSTKLVAPVIFAVAALCSTASFAGRPLAVDDANTADAGTGNVDLWYSRHPGNVNSWTLSPAYGITDGIELGAVLSNDNTNNVNTSALQAKFRLTGSKKDGCNFGASVGVSQVGNGGGNTPYINGLMTCNMEAGSMNLNLGLARGPDGPTLNTWGISFEREVGAFTPHVEFYGVERSAPTLQLGLRTMVTKSLQLDGSVGSTSGETFYTLGMRFFF